MKLKNKKTGEIVELDHISAHYSRHYDYGEGKSGEQPCSTWDKTLAELNEEWEDYEEPKGYWYIDYAAPYPVDFCEFNEDTEDDKEIGNYFKTKEEAEKAVEKLRAYKRLKDKGFKFRDWDTSHHNLGVIEFFLPDVVNDFDKYIKDLDLLFGGEE